MVLISRTIKNFGEDWRENEKEFILDHDFFKGKKILKITNYDLNWFVTVEDKRKKSGYSMYVVHLSDWVTKRISPTEFEKVHRIHWILKKKNNNRPYSWSINGQPMKNTEQVYYEDDYKIANEMRRH